MGVSSPLEKKGTDVGVESQGSFWAVDNPDTRNCWETFGGRISAEWGGSRTEVIGTSSNNSRRLETNLNNGDREGERDGAVGDESERDNGEYIRRDN